MNKRGDVIGRIKYCKRVTNYQGQKTWAVFISTPKGTERRLVFTPEADSQVNFLTIGFTYRFKLDLLGQVKKVSDPQ